MPLRASSVSALDAMARVFARRAFRDAAETAGAAWTLETRDGVSRLKDLESALERRGESRRARKLYAYLLEQTPDSAFLRRKLESRGDG